MENPEDIDRDKVRNEFDKRIKNHGNIHAVLDANFSGVLTEHQNRLRDCISRKALRRFLNPKKFEDILDFGCGMGRNTFYISPFAKTVTGIDVSEQMIIAAKRKNINFCNIEFYHYDGNKVDFPDSKFHKIAIVWVLQHIGNNDMKLLISEFFRLLKPHGKIVFLEQISPELKVYDQIHIQRTLSDYQSAFEDAGFKLILLKPVFRMPSYAMDIWKKMRFLSFLGPLPFVWLERFTLNRKIQSATYITYAFEFEKPENGLK